MTGARTGQSADRIRSRLRNRPVLVRILVHGNRKRFLDLRLVRYRPPTRQPHSKHAERKNGRRSHGKTEAVMDPLNNLPSGPRTRTGPDPKIRPKQKKESRTTLRHPHQQTYQQRGIQRDEMPSERNRKPTRKTERRYKRAPPRTTPF